MNKKQLFTIRVPCRLLNLSQYLQLVSKDLCVRVSWNHDNMVSRTCKCKSNMPKPTRWPSPCVMPVPSTPQWNAICAWMISFKIKNVEPPFVYVACGKASTCSWCWRSSPSNRPCIRGEDGECSSSINLWIQIKNLGLILIGARRSIRKSYYYMVWSAFGVFTLKLKRDFDFKMGFEVWWSSTINQQKKWHVDGSMRAHALPS